VEAHGCDSSALRDPAAVDALFSDIVRELCLHPLQDTALHKFPGEGGVTGFLMLTESHLACHTFPEYGSLCLNLFCCRPRADFAFADYLRKAFGADSVHVRRVDRPYRP
jgi:S-adenosylmethionine decarboxylase